MQSFISVKYAGPPKSQQCHNQTHRKIHDTSHEDLIAMLIDRRIEHFIKREGRRPRILVSNMAEIGTDEAYDHDIKVLAAYFAEMGFDVDISPLRQKPHGTARMAVENDVHIICFLSNGNRYKTLVTDLVKRLDAEKADNIKIVIGGSIPRSDYKLLYDAGVDLILRSVPTDQSTIILILDWFE